MIRAKRLSECSDAEMRALTGTSGVLCDKCGSTAHNTAGHPRIEPGCPACEFITETCRTTKVGGCGEHDG